jgi:hypothetical protein
MAQSMYGEVASSTPSRKRCQWRTASMFGARRITSPESGGDRAAIKAFAADTPAPPGARSSARPVR